MFDKKRVERHKTLKKFYSTDEIYKTMVEAAIVDDILDPGSAEEKLSTIFPPDASMHALKFFDFMQTHITLQSNGMGVSLRESRGGIVKLMEKEGYDYPIYQNFITNFENKLLAQHYDT